MTPIPEFSSAVLMEPFKKLFLKYGFVFWLATIIALMLGFKTFTPNERLAAVEGKVDVLQAREESDALLRKAEARWMCLHSNPQEKALLPELECK